MWKFQEILREIDFEDSRSAKSANLTHSEALNFGFYEFKPFLRQKFTESTKFRALTMEKMVLLQLLNSTKLVSRKIQVTENS